MHSKFDSHDGAIANAAQRVALPNIKIERRIFVDEGDPGGANWFSTKGADIVDSHGTVVRLTGVNWFGAETSRMAPDGLFTRNWHDMMDQMDSLGFNTIRLPFSNDALHATGTPNNINTSINPDLAGLTPIQVIDKIVDYAGDIGMRIILDDHRNTAGDGPNGNGLWYGNGSYTEAKWLSDWQFVADRYKDNPTVVGFDLSNEPYNASWGSNNAATDWRLGAEKAIDAIHHINPKVLTIVEGIGGDYWWGGNLKDARNNPIRLDHPDKLVYSAHDYPNSVYPQPWFSDPSYPGNLPAVWDRNWGYLDKENTAPVLLGEFGSKLQDSKDVQWFDKIVPYLVERGLSWTFWAWNPNSGDTGGILQDDWRTVVQEKINRLTPALGGDLPDAGSGATTVTATLHVTLSAAAKTQVSMDWTTKDGTAKAGLDYTAAHGTLVFAPGETTKTINVAVLPDNLKEPNENFTVVLSNASGGTLKTTTGQVTIRDDDHVTLFGSAAKSAASGIDAFHAGHRSGLDDTDASQRAAHDGWNGDPTLSLHLNAQHGMGDLLLL